MSGKRSRSQNRATNKAAAASSAFSKSAATSKKKQTVTNLDDEQREDPVDGRKKRATVPLAKDADLVLRKCRELRDQLRNEDESNDDEEDDRSTNSSGCTSDDDLSFLLDRSSAVARKPPAAVAALPEDVSSKDIVEVSELSSAQVLEGMETIALRVAHQVLNKQGFSLDIPSRAASNQIYVKEWDRIVLGSKRSTRSFLNVKESRKSAITLRVMQLLHAV
jgi:hypothetical protein